VDVPGGGAEPAFEAVNGAYRVIDEYLRQGQQVAQDFWLPMGQSSAAPESRLLERFVRATGDLATAWLEMFQTRPDAKPTAPAGGIGPFGIGERQPAPARTPEAELGFAVAVTTSRTVTVHIDVRPNANPDQLILGDLLAAIGSAPPIRGAACELIEPGHRYVFSITVPPEQPAGVYNAMLIELGTQLPKGTVSLQVA